MLNPWPDHWPDAGWQIRASRYFNCCEYSWTDTRGVTFQKPRAGKTTKPICQYDREGNFIREFPSVKEAAGAMSMTPGAISFSMQKPNRTAGGYRWKLKEK